MTITADQIADGYKKTTIAYPFPDYSQEEFWETAEAKYGKSVVTLRGYSEFKQKQAQKNTDVKTS